MTSMLTKIVGFTVAYYDWVRAGRPKRDPLWVAELWDICSQCPHFDPRQITPFGRGACDICGCHISPDHTENFNKLVWPTQSCPDSPPHWTAAVDGNPEKHGCK